jgi:integrase
VYRVFLGTINGKKKYRQFSSQTDADTFVNQGNVEIQANIYKESIGDLGELMSVRYEALNCLNRLKLVGASLTDATDYFLKFAKPINGAITIKDACESFLKMKTTSGRSTKYIRGLRTHDFKSFREHFGDDTKLGDVTSTKFNNYIFGKKSWNPTSKLSHIRFMSVLFNYCLREGFVTSNPIKQIERPQQENKAPSILRIGETQKMLNLALKKDFKDVLAVMTLVLFCGVRVEEASKIRWSDFEWKTFIVNVSEKIAKKTSSPLQRNSFEWSRVVNVGKAG